MNTENSSPIEHQNVPQEHRGLHDFLYSSPDEHGLASATTVAVAPDTYLPIDDWCAEIQNAKVAGVYAVFDRQQQPQYIGYSRNIALSLRSHLTQQGDDICAFVQVRPFKFPKRDEMEQSRNQWIAEFPTPPPGNLNNSGDWASTVRDAATQAMSESERAIYEEKKLKLRRAMADGTLHREATAIAPTDNSSPDPLLAQLQDDNWSAVIGEQTQETHR